MKLPRFPIRKSLIPYEDLGIQDVSPDNQILGDDIPITIAALEAMGKHGARMLQVDDAGALIVNVGKPNNYKYGGKSRVLGDFHFTDTIQSFDGIDLSEFSMLLTVVTISNYTDVGTNLHFALYILDDLGNANNGITVADINGNYTDYTFNQNGVDSVIFTDNMQLYCGSLTTGNSCDAHVYLQGI